MLHFCRWQYRSIFNHFDVIGHKATEFDEITQMDQIGAIEEPRLINNQENFQLHSRFTTSENVKISQKVLEATFLTHTVVV